LVDYNSLFKKSQNLSTSAVETKKGIKDCWKEYMEKLMNEEYEWDHKISVEVKEGPADCIRMDEVRAALKNIGADSTGATGNFAPVLTQEPGQTLRFAPVPFMAVL